MGSFYSGFGAHKSHLGHCEEGIIYSGQTPIGRYENGNIYNQFKEHVGSYSGGSIYNQFHEHIASYANGIVYNKYLNVAVGKEQVGSYEEDPAEAAALVLLFLDGNDINNRSRVKTEENFTTYSSSGSSEVDLLSIIVGLIVLLIKVIPALFMYFLLPLLCSQTIWFCLFIFLSAPLIGFNPFIAYGEMVIMYVVALPYWYILFAQKRKKRMTWKETYKYYRKWYIKGPWAYKDINELKNKPMGN